MQISVLIRLAIGCLLCESVVAQTWQTTSGNLWSTAANWGGTLPTNDGTADLIFSQVTNPALTHGTTVLDLDWNIRSLNWNSSSLDNGVASISSNNGRMLTLQNGLSNNSGGRVNLSIDMGLAADQTWSGGETYVTGTISGPGQLVKTGGGNLILHGPNTHDGGTALSFGILTVGDDQALGTGSFSWGGSYFSSLRGEAGMGARTISNSVILRNGKVYGEEAFTFTGTVNMEGATRSVYGQTAVTTFTNTISNGGLTLDGGNFALRGSNTFAGGLRLVGSGTTTVQSDAALGAATGLLTFEGGTLRTIGSFSSNRPVHITQYQGTIQTDAGTVLTVRGAITHTATGYEVLNKKGAGTLVLAGNSIDPYFLNVTEGVVSIENTPSAATFRAFVRSGSTLTGNGSVGDLTVATGGHLAPGTALPGTLNVTNYLQLGGGSVLDFDLGVNQFDRIVMASGGQVIRASSSPSMAPIYFNFSDSGGLAVGQTYTLIDWTQGSLGLRVFKKKTTLLKNSLNSSNRGSRRG